MSVGPCVATTGGVLAPSGEAAGCLVFLQHRPRTAPHGQALSSLCASVSPQGWGTAGHSWRSSVSCAQPVRDTERRSSVGQTRVQPPRGLSQNPRAAPQWPRVPVAAPRGRCAAGRAHACRVQPPGGSIPAEALSPRLSKRRAEPGPPRGERPASHPGFQAASEKEKNPERLVTQPATRL